MAGNTFGHLFRLTTFGESHGEAIGGVIDGCPAGIAFVAQAEEGCRTRQAETGLRTTVGRGASAAAHVGTK